MIHNLKPYPVYQDSGVPWLGEVPAHWTTERLKSSVTNVVEPGTERRGKDLYVALEHVESWTGQLNGAPPDVGPDSQLKRFAPGDVLFGKLRPYLAKVTRPTTGGLCVGEFLVLRPRDTTFDTGFLERLLRAKPIIDTVDASTFGAKMPRADWTFIGSMKVVQPPLAEQAAIVLFLDHADRRIQRYIRAREKLIALLEEQKQALIHEAGTGRIDVRTGKPYPAYKPSGVEWLGEVPADWGEAPLGRCLRHIAQGWSPTAAEGEIQPNQWAVLALSSVKRGMFDSTAIKPIPISAKIPEGIEIENGDLLLTRSNTRDLVGDVCIVEGARPKTVISDLIYRLTPKPAILERRLLMFQLLSALGRRQIERDARGSSATMPKIAHHHIRSWRVLIPPRDEQQCIVKVIRDAEKAINGAVEGVRAKLSLLHEYRTLLIADVVTGKIDVREAEAA
ncbi:MAG: hypothetical protein OXU42_08285, partial [Deltaproteobacteria bacterium]|nr:hypothetical protein [Deltaproteobacteria bacterium]